MNKEINLSITTLKVEIRVLVLDGKRFTKSVFDQLPVLEYLPWKSGRANLIGYVQLQCRWFIFQMEGLLYKADVLEWGVVDSGMVWPGEPEPEVISSLTDVMEHYRSKNKHDKWVAEYERWYSRECAAIRKEILESQIGLVTNSDQIFISI